MFLMCIGQTVFFFKEIHFEKKEKTKSENWADRWGWQDTEVLSKLYPKPVPEITKRK